MKLQIKFLMPVVALSLNACALRPPPHLPGAQSTYAGGTAYVITQLTASTWTLTMPDLRILLPTGPEGQAALRVAVEKHTGCKVTDSNYASQGLQLDAQVDCANRLKN